MKRHLPSFRGRRFRYSAVAIVALLALGGVEQAPSHAGNARADRGDAGTGHPLIRDAGLASGLPTAVVAASGDKIPRSWSGIPQTVFSAYSRAADSEQATDPGCHLGWPLLAAIGKVESNHADGGGVALDGTMVQPLFGPPLDGNNGTIQLLDATILSGRPQWVRAEGPMQFLPSTWARWAADGDGDGKKNVQNVYDASLGAAHYLCADNADLATPSGLRAAILRYNPSWNYLDAVSSWLSVYTNGVTVVPDDPGGRLGSLGTSEVSKPSGPSTSAPQQQAQAAPPAPAPQPAPQPPASRQPAAPKQPSPAPSPQPSPLPVGQLLQPATQLVSNLTQPLTGHRPS